MQQFDECNHCAGFLPTGVGACPHCGTHARENTAKVTPAARLLNAATRVALGGAMAVTLMACYGAPQNYKPVAPPPELPCDGKPDADGDGVCPPEDCGPTDATIHPGATDIVGDGIDQDCDGADAIAPATDGVLKQE